jgi:hypothetical protein
MTALDRAKTVDRATIVVSVSPERRVQIDVFPATGGDMYWELTPGNARAIGRAIVKTADDLEPPARRRH